MSTKRGLALLTILLGIAAPAFADDVANVASGAASVGANFFSRHLDISSAEMGLRFNTQRADGQAIPTRDSQYRVATHIQFRLDSEGSTYLQSEVESGSGFLSGWTNSGVGQHPALWAYNPKTFYLNHKFASIAEIQVGGLRFDEGAGTGATYANAGGWTEGYRMVLQSSNPQAWLPNKFGVTVGHIGDFSQPNFFQRADRMAEPNYAQALVQKKFLQHEASLEFNSIQSVYFVRGALHAQEIAKTDNLTIEFINRTNRNAAFGWSATIDKHLDHAQRWLAGLTYSDLPMKMFNKSGTQILLNSAGLGFGK